MFTGHLSKISVLTAAGVTQFTVIGCSDNSFPNDFVNPITAAFDEL